MSIRALRLNRALPPAGNAHVGRLTSIPRMAKMYFENNRFSERENDVIKLLVQGKSNKQIALELGISSRTVEFHLSNIYTKLGVKSRSEAILKVTDSQLRKSTGDDQVIPTRIPANIQPDALLQAMQRDKKKRAGQIRFILLRGIGQAFVSDEVPNSEVLATISAVTVS